MLKNFGKFLMLVEVIQLGILGSLCAGSSTEEGESNVIHIRSSIKKTAYSIAHSFFCSTCNNSLTTNIHDNVEFNTAQFIVIACNDAF